MNGLMGMGAQLGPGAQALGGQVDPQSYYLQQALAGMRQQPQGNAMGLTSNLLADALDQYSLNKRGNDLAIAKAQQGTSPDVLKGLW